MKRVRRRAGGALIAILLAPALAAGVSCGKDARPRPAAERATAEERAAPDTLVRGQRAEDEGRLPPPEAGGENLALAKAIDRKVCRKRGCCVSAIEDAGTDRKGRSLVVATIDAGYGGAASCLVPPPIEPEPFGNGALDKEPSPIEPRAQAQTASDEGGADQSDEAGDDAEPAEHDPSQDDCRPYEYHLIVHSRGKIKARQLLSQQCNNGYGAAGVGEDEVSVDKEARTFTHKQSGGSAWRWDKSVEVGLDPLRIVGIDESSFWTMDEDGTFKSADWNHDTFEGKEMSSFPDCEGRRKQQEAMKRDAAASSDDVAASKASNALIVPRAQLPPAFVASGWRSIGLGDCGAFVDGNEHGFAVYGGKGGAADASFRAVVSKDGVLFVEIDDDHWTSAGKSWVKEDHLELWIAPSGTPPVETICDEPQAADPSLQWGIRISDGQVFPAFGSPAPLAGVEVVRSGRQARARIPIADWLKGEDDATALTVVYSDSDDGLHQKRLIATSQLERGHMLSLGHVRDVDPGHATCVIKGKTLQIHRPPFATSPNEAIADP
jgi:hypothetical protein